jgi:nicotinamidase-related amidase
MSDGLRFGLLGVRTVHLCIDMQRLFAGDTPWTMPWMQRILPEVVRLVEAHPDRTIFTRFLPPRRPDDARGAWRRYYERWRDVTLDSADPRWMELAPDLARFVPPAAVVDKRVYSPFSTRTLEQLLRSKESDALVISGGETDVCVLATVLGAVDRGYRVVLASDAVCSASDRTHDALMTLYRERFAEQIETATTETILANWV